MYTESQILTAARAAHEVNRTYCIEIGDLYSVPWDDAPGWMQESAILGVRGIIAGNTPEQSHEGWLAHKRATGWVYGPKKDEGKKTHPCMVSYSELPTAQRVKDTLFHAVVRGVLGIE